MDWQDESRMLQLERLLEEATDLLLEFGAWDPINETDNKPVRDFLDRNELREVLR
jgi:DNA primase large subunit